MSAMVACARGTGQRENVGSGTEPEYGEEIRLSAAIHLDGLGLVVVRGWASPGV